MTTNSQVVNTGINDTAAEKSLKKFNVSAYVDTYWGTDFQNKNHSDIPYMVSMNKINQPYINLAMIDFRYQSKNFRVKLLPGFGTYMKANYSNENGIAQYLVEANAGILLSKKRAIWLDAGILSSPYTNESAISKDQLLYTRALGPEYSPYYLTGFKASIPIQKKINLYLYLINGWQEIKRQGNSLAFGTQVEYRPNDKNLFNWNTYFGNESSSITPSYRNRYFTDFYWLHNPNKKMAIALSAYWGIQEKIIANGNKVSNNWGQMNLSMSYQFAKKWSVSGRVERFIDPNSVMVNPITPINGFSTNSVSTCLNLSINEHILWRTECRIFSSANNLYLNQQNIPANQLVWGISSITIRF
ncbi:MAG: porin [Sphingobacteriia bacterium]|nr:MAG: porin [Sphingobacteriia bacterium]